MLHTSVNSNLKVFMKYLIWKASVQILLVGVVCLSRKVHCSLKLDDLIGASPACTSIEAHCDTGATRMQDDSCRRLAREESTRAAYSYCDDCGCPVCVLSPFRRRGSPGIDPLGWRWQTFRIERILTLISSSAYWNINNDCKYSIRQHNNNNKNDNI